MHHRPLTPDRGERLLVVPNAVFRWFGEVEDEPFPYVLAF